MGGDEQQGRVLATPGGSLMPSMTYSKDKARGNGKGQAIL